MTEKNLVIPRWFLVVVSAVFVLFSVSFIPWAVWVTKTLVIIDARSEAFTQSNARIDALDAASRNSFLTMSDRLSRIEGSLSAYKEREKEKTN